MIWQAFLKAIGAGATKLAQVVHDAKHVPISREGIDLRA